MRIVSFNTHHGLASSGRSVDTAMLTRYCAGLGADVLALQEVDVGARRSGRADQAQVVAEATGMEVVFGAARRTGWRGRYGNALLVRGRIESSRVLVLPQVGRREWRCAIVAGLVVGERRLSVAATHLSVYPEEAAAQLKAVLGALAPLDRPRVVLGDLNLRADQLAPALAASSYALADADRPTFPAAAPQHRIDHVLTEGLDVLSVEVLDAGPVSDHRALVVDVR